MCNCINTQYWNGSLCISKKTYNSTCVSSDECLGALFCNRGQCKCDRADYWSGSKCSQKSLECEDVKDTKDGVYIIYPGGGETAVAVYCIMRQTKKWTVIQRRVNGSVDFYRTWKEYKTGFGSVYGEYWLGNDNINIISTNGHHELSIYMQDGSVHHKANYSTFVVGNENSKYRLTVTGYSGLAGGDIMDKVDNTVKANGQPFTTKDRDNDNYDLNCAVKYKSAWWFNDCYYSDFNRAYKFFFGSSFCCCKIENGNEEAPVYLQELVHIYKPMRALRSENAMIITTPRVRTKTYGERRFDKAAAVLWNNLPSDLRNIHSVNVFKKNLKTHLFRHAFHSS
ncbi:Fibrinogen-like protein 1,Tenascin,Ryncolin-2,Ryncolin-4,Angiopoietin-related protein 6,Angiopoietin-related protein 2,Angiopoietin-related protein 7,Ficolin-2,Ryncolin-1,Tenascin-R,Ryncolin-3,Ficolin-1,Fibrinogen C domain-containing protein 1 [Mytilus coruscus]|uniref:Fibrinogen C-terminal domain-containing protein n=1 Tax=Mytilus coruscus TaxID=42192 RepID=A0A6J8EVC0_MYTCO|nr:Fibrinogen-like protein 1,Tenascin,Ryncolin-2,Ryncolin-4,Angiopoietin-related protein 6,Angiopoietin-related protein 2,Angiopoietin-related protein 7,Ficolin-2,Ryncolin-1,Tenascin-R,Ryncolin-3,Ficolin-1,Fibrinogen C domain-containing protein 1 [Mytilus coruscus]